MIRTFCDACGAELFGEENRVTNRIKRCLGDVTVEIMVRTGATWNYGHVCAKCVLDVAEKGADL